MFIFCLWLRQLQTKPETSHVAMGNKAA